MPSYQEILSAMQEEYRMRTGFPADDASDVGIRLKALAVQLAALSDRIDTLEAQVFPQTAQGQALEYHAATRGLSRKGATYALGSLRFSRATPAPADIVIPAGAVCAAADGSLRFQTTGQGLLPSGSTSVEVEARAVEPGSRGNAAPSVVQVMITPVQGVSLVSNPTAFTGGGDAEQDDALRARLMRSFESISNGANAAFYYDFAMGFEGIASANVVPRANGRGTVAVYVAGAGAAPAEELVEEIRAQLAHEREIGVDVTVQAARLHPVGISVEIDGENGADFDALSSACRKSAQAFFSALPVGQGLRLAALADALYHTAALRNIHLLAPASDLPSQADTLFTLGELSISRMEVVV